MADTLLAIRRHCHDWHIAATPLPPGADGTGRIACLVPRTGAGDVIPRLVALAGIESGLRVTVLGPLPPYHFVDSTVA